MRLVDTGGRTAQDLGFSRIAGQILVYLYLCETESSLDTMEADLKLSKAAASTAARQLEGMGLLKRVWKPGDRKSYYRTTDNLADVFRDGMVAILRRKLELAGTELEQTRQLLQHCDEDDPEVHFFKHRIQRASDLNQRAHRLLNSRLLRYLAK